MACATFATELYNATIFFQKHKISFLHHPKDLFFKYSSLNYVIVAKLRFFNFMGCTVAALYVAITNTFATGLYSSGKKVSIRWRVLITLACIPTFLP
jgi:hypothetical protein